MTDQSESNQKKNLPFYIWIVIPVLLSGFIYLSMKLDSTSSTRNKVAEGETEKASSKTSGKKNQAGEKDDLFQTALSLKSQDALRALGYFNQISADSPHYSEALKHAAHIYFLAGDYSAAETKLLEVNKQVPDDPLVLLSLAELHIKKSDYKRALQYATRSSELLPERVETYLLIADIQDELDHPEKMISLLKRVLEFDSQNQAAHLNLLYAYHYTGEYESARREAEWCLSHGSKTVFVYQTLAKIEIDQGHTELAAELIQKAIALDPDNMESLIIQADLLLYKKKSAEAYKTLKRIYDENQNNIRYIGALARVAARNGDVKTAKALHEKLAEYHRQRK